MENYSKNLLKVTYYIKIELRCSIFIASQETISLLLWMNHKYFLFLHLQPKKAEEILGQSSQQQGKWKLLWCSEI